MSTFQKFNLQLFVASIKYYNYFYIVIYFISILLKEFIISDSFLIDPNRFSTWAVKSCDIKDNFTSSFTRQILLLFFMI
jgi:hypothetical protein